MKTNSLALMTAGLGLLLTQAPAWAHHAFAAEYDPNRPATMTGAVTKMEWTNPHARFYVDVKDTDGKTVNWEFELGSPNALMRRGWLKTSIKPGDMVTVSGYLAKDGSHLANARSVSMGGRSVFAGSPEDGGPVQ